MAKEEEYQRIGADRLEIKPRAKLLSRKVARIETAAALETLHTHLATATVIFEKHGDAGREGAWQAIISVIDFLRGQGIPVQALLPLSSIATGLIDLDRRVSSPLFKPKRGAGKPPKSTIDGAIDALLAVVSECCVRRCKKDGSTDFLIAGATEAARLINASPIAVRVTETQMREVRETIAQMQAAEPRRKLFDELMRDANRAPSLATWVEQFVSGGWVPKPVISE